MIRIAANRFTLVSQRFNNILKLVMNDSYKICRLVNLYMIHTLKQIIFIRIQIRMRIIMRFYNRCKNLKKKIEDVIYLS